MTWRLEDIERDWIGPEVSALAASPDSVVAAFDRTERTLGREWIEKSRISVGNIVRGVSPTLRVVNMGQKLVLENVTGPERLLDRIRNGDLSAEGELTAIYLLRSRKPDVAVELYPKVGEREADFRVRTPDEQLWTYVEVTQLSESEANDRAREIMERIAAAIKPIRLTFALEAFLRRIPTQPEIGEILAKVPEFCSRSGKQREELSNSLGFLSLNQSEPGEVVTHAHAGEEAVSRLGMARVITGPGEPRLPHIGQDGFFRRSSKKRRFQPKIHTRVSGVCLWQGGLFTTPKGEDQLFETKLIVNPHARLLLPGWIGNALAEIGDEFKSITSA